MSVRITVTDAGYLVRGGTAGRTARALESVRALERAGKNLANVAAFVTELDVALQAQGEQVETSVHPTCQIRHTCGATYTQTEWERLGRVDQDVRCLETEPPQFLRMRNCARCRSTVSLASCVIERRPVAKRGASSPIAEAVRAHCER